MSFLNPWLLLGVMGLSLPILAHMLNRFQVKQTDWAAMRFLNRSVRVRSRQLKLRDIILLILRCLALLLIVMALTRPAIKQDHAAILPLGEPRAAVIIAVDASFSMQQGEEGRTRFESALDLLDTITGELRAGDPLTILLLAGEHRVVARNVAFAPDEYAELRDTLAATHETLDIDSVPRLLKELLQEMKAHQKEVYLISDMQSHDWKPGSSWLNDAFRDLTSQASVFLLPVAGGTENLALTGLELVSGVLRKNTSARYRATVRNCGTTVAQQVRVMGRVNNIVADTKFIPSIAPGASESVSLFLPFSDPGPVRIVAEVEWQEDTLAVDNVRHAVAVVRDRVSVLCVEGSSDGMGASGGLIATALRARGDSSNQDDLEVQSVSWVDLPRQDLKAFDVVVLSDVPDITVELSDALDAYVREGKGLIWFGGENVKADVWNQRSAREGTPLLPAVIEQRVQTSDAMGIGRPLDPSMTDHPVCRPLFSLPEDLLSETRFHTLLQVSPSATGTKVLALAGRDAPVLLEHGLGRGHVFMFTTSAGSVWNNMAVTPVFPMLLQQMVTYLTSREFETARLVGESLFLSYEDQPDAPDAVFDAPSGETVEVPVKGYRDRYVAILDGAREAGFYLARVSLQSAGMPIAVNVDTRESMTVSMTHDDVSASLEGSGVKVLLAKDDILPAIKDVRTSRSLWRLCLLAGLAFLLVESLLARLLHQRALRREGTAGGEGRS